MLSFEDIKATRFACSYFFIGETKNYLITNKKEHPTCSPNTYTEMTVVLEDKLHMIILSKSRRYNKGIILMNKRNYNNSSNL